jgi:light-regulated signal transduction histidine kinase (bacteriophytochrome)
MPDSSSSQPVRASVDTQDTGRANLRATVERLTRANDDLKRIVLVTGHDMQQPLRTISAACEHLLAEGTPPATLGCVLRSAARVREIVQALLSYCVVTAPQGAVWSDTKLESVCREVEFRLASEIAESGARIERESLPTVCCDRDGMIQIFQNLIGNAIKYRKPSVAPVIRISTERRSEEWILKLTDNGIGFDTRYAERIFEPFRRLHGNEIPGTGIGLAICQSIVEQHGGRIWAESSPESGSTFCFTIPCVR